MTPTLHTLINLLNPWRTIRRLEAENQRLDAQAATLHSLLKTALAKNAAYERSRLRHCRAHGQQPPNAWGCPECVRELRRDLDDAQEQLATAQQALRRLERWGAFRGVLPDVNAWTQSGMTGPLPPLPEHLATWEQPDAGEGL
ncbi:MAG: hypothetical protein LW834_06830 [Cyanobium sp. 49614_E6]|jgi:hypothetical protein|nr:hypothetical protein [Cyanobium sp. 49614_E6]MCE2836660.1 hypothetical protein [Cyanobium sp. 49614_E6]